MASAAHSERRGPAHPIRTTITIIITPESVLQNRCYLTIQPPVAPSLTRQAIFAWLENPALPRNYSRIFVWVLPTVKALEYTRTTEDIDYTVAAITSSPAIFTHTILDYSSGLYQITTPFFTLLHRISTITRVHIITDATDHPYANIWDWGDIPPSFPITSIRAIEYAHLSCSDDYAMLHRLAEISVTHIVCKVNATIPAEFGPVRPLLSVKCARFSVACINPSVPTAVAAANVVRSVQRVLDMCPVLTQLTLSIIATAHDRARNELNDAIIAAFHRVHHPSLAVVYCDPEYTHHFENKHAFPRVAYLQHRDNIENSPSRQPRPQPAATRFRSGTSHMDRPRRNPTGPLLTAFLLAIQRLADMSTDMAAYAEAPPLDTLPDGYVAQVDPDVFVDAFRRLDIPGPEDDDDDDASFRPPPMPPPTQTTTCRFYR